MEIKMTSTDRTVELDGVLVRVWDGWTGGGIRCWVFVHRVAAGLSGDTTEFERELVEKPTPMRVAGDAVLSSELLLLREAVARRIDEDWLSRARSVLREYGLLP